MDNEKLNSEKIQRKLQNLKPYKPGESGNPEGKPKGAKNFKTLFYEALKKIAEQEKVSPEDLEFRLVQKAFDEASKGNFNFWRDLHDRLYGKPTETHKIEGDIRVQKLEEIEQKLKETLFNKND